MIIANLTMALTPGTHFGSYQVGESIGLGSMGVVYRATDTNLRRDVALKVLPQTFVEDVDRLARFQREAEVLASLNHPNIATIYGLEKTDNQTVIVMELVDGPNRAWDVDPGDDRILAITLPAFWEFSSESATEGGEEDGNRISVGLNWFEELRERVQP